MKMKVLSDMATFADWYHVAFQPSGQCVLAFRYRKHLSDGLSSGTVYLKDKTKPLPSSWFAA